MADPTLLDVTQQRFDVAIDPDSDGGQILNSLTPHPPFDDHALTGTADVAPPLSFVLTSSGVSVRRYKPQEADMLVFSLPSSSIDFTLVPPDAAHAFPQVELKLHSLTVPIPFLRAAKVTSDGTMQEAGGEAELRFPDLLLVVNASATPPASAHLAPSHDAAGALEVTMAPPHHALFGPSTFGTVVGLGFERAILNLGGPGEPEISVPDVEVYVAPPGIKALAMHGGGHDLHLGLGVSGGLSGDFQVAPADGEAAAARPRFLHNLAAHLRLNHNSITLLELTGQIDVPGEVSARVGPLDDPGGQIDYVLSLALDNGWQASLTLSMSAGRTYLWRTQSNDAETRHPPLDTLGAYAVFTPLLLPTLPGAGSSGYVDLTLGAGVAAGLATSGAVHTVSVTLYGGELVVRQPGGGEPEAFLFFDLETELHFKVKIGDTPLLATRRPLKVRHKAIGLRLDFGPNSGSPQLKPVFDPARGFSLDLSDPGMFEVPAQLGDIVQPDGARMARENPLHFEIDLVLKADLGVVTIDRASVRIPVDPAGPPSLTALGAHLNVGMMSGGGYLQFLSDGGLSGGLDFSLAPPLGVRGSGNLRLDKVHATNEDLTAVLAGLGVEWPIPIPLGNSGLGMFGILGMFAMHMERNQMPPQNALDWFENTANGNAAKSTAWKGVADQWGFGAGMVIGTVEGGFLIHAKGMLILELPGPRILMVMNADILSPRPAKEGTDTGTFLAVIDIEPGSLTIGIVLDYHPLKPLLEVRVPAEAFFDFTQVENWRLDVGGLPPKLPASVKFLFGFHADGYLLIHGNGIPEPKDPHPSKEDFPLVPLPGFSVAAGIQVALTWGPEAIGLYLKIAAKAAVGISFKPFMVVGHIALSGELHLFVVSVGASASADLIITLEKFYVHADVCGEVDFFLFSVQGCVTMELGDQPSPPAPEPLFRALSLHSRTPALLPDSGSDRPVDGSLGNAFHFDSQSGQWVGDKPDAILPVVPIDAIPVLQCEMRPCVASGCQFFDQPIASMLASNDWVRRGQRFYRYTLKTVTLTGTRSDGGPLDTPIGDGETPYVWWDRNGATPKNDDRDVQLALLSWLPDPTPAAAERTVTLDERVKERWGTICVGIAGPAAVLWTFRQSRLGPSIPGWTLTGTPWPDPPGTTRSAPPDPILRVSEPWRASNPLADTLVQVNQAYVLGSAAVLDRLLIAPHTGKTLSPRVVGDGVFNALFQELHPQPLNALADAVRLDTHGLRHIRVLLFVLEQVWGKGLLEVRSPDAAGKATGFEQVLTLTNSRLLSTTNDLPGEWGDPASPWFPAVRDVLNAWQQVYMALLHEPLLVFFEANLPAGTTQVELGLRGDFTAPMPAWGLLIAEGLTEAEVLRHGFDKTSRQNTIKMVNGALGADASKRALLHKDAIYTVSVNYDVQVTDPDEKTGQPKAPPGPLLTDQKQQFRFQTDAAPPDRLEPWVMATDPAQDEQCFFYGDPLLVIFSTNATRKLFKEYQRELFAVVKAASGNHPQGGNRFDPATISLEHTVVAPKALAMQVTTPFEGALHDVLTPYIIKAAEAVVTTPLEGALRDVAACIGPLETTTPHELVTLTMKLEPLTNYILDLEAHSLEGPPPAAPPLHPLFRRNFSTSRYASMRDLANAVLQSGVEHRWLATIKPLSDLAARNPGSAVLAVRDLEMQEALRQVRWGDLARAGQPRVTVIWQDGAGGAPPQPFALLLETPEPLWRERQIVTEPAGDPNAVRRYKLVPRPWLDLVETTAVARFVHSTDGGRTLVVLQPTARGTTLNLALRRTHSTLFEGDAPPETAPLVAVSLMKAPWEDQL